MGQTVIAVAEVAMAFFTLCVLVANVVSIRKFNDSLELTQRSLGVAKRAADDAWKIAQGQMLLQANRDFFNQEPHKAIIRRLEMGDSVWKSNPHIQECDIDDHIGFLDTIGTFVRASILDANLVWELFSHYVESAHESEEIAEYLRKVRQEANEPGLFSDFEWLYAEMTTISDAKNRKK
jgi:hypothetical protein